MKQKGLLRTIVKDSSENAPDTAAYFKGVFSLYIHKKIRRLVEAIYLVTNHLENTESLKKAIREKATEIVNLSIKIKGDRISESGSVLYEEIISGIAGIISFLEIAAVSGMIGESNYYLINKELNTIFKSLSDRLRDHSDPSDSLPMSFFEIDMSGSTNYGVNIQKDKNIKDTSVTIINKDFSITDDRVLTGDITEEPLYKKESKIADFNDENKSKKILRTVEKLDREKTILEFFKDNRKMTIKDISSLLPQYSEKTIQREILRLVNVGILSKSGKKRWTLYFMV